MSACLASALDYMNKGSFKNIDIHKDLDTAEFKETVDVNQHFDVAPSTSYCRETSLLSM